MVIAAAWGYGFDMYYPRESRIVVASKIKIFSFRRYPFLCFVIVAAEAVCCIERCGSSELAMRRGPIRRMPACFMHDQVSRQPPKSKFLGCYLSLPTSGFPGRIVLDARVIYRCFTLWDRVQVPNSWAPLLLAALTSASTVGM